MLPGAGDSFEYDRQIAIQLQQGATRAFGPFIAGLSGTLFRRRAWLCGTPGILFCAVQPKAREEGSSIEEASARSVISPREEK